MSKGNIYAALYKGYDNIAIYQLIIKYGTHEKITENNLARFRFFSQAFRGMVDPFFHKGSSDDVQVPLGSEGERTIIRTTSGRDFPAVIGGIEEIAKQWDGWDVNLVTGDEAKPVLDKLIPLMLLCTEERPDYRFFETLRELK